MMKIWHKIITLGLRPGLSPLEFRQIQSINGLGLVAALLLVLLCIINIAYVGYLAAAADVVAICLVILPIWYLNYKGRYTSSSILAYFGGVLIVTTLGCYNSIYQRPLGTEVTLVALSPGAILFFRGRMKVFAFLFTVACYGLIYALKLIYYEGPPSLYVFHIFLVLFAFALTYSLSNIYKNSYLATQSQIINKNMELEVQKNEITKQAFELNETVKAKNKIFSIISHDLRSPIVSLNSIVQLASKKQLKQDEAGMLLEELSKSLSYNKDFLDNLLFWARSQMEGGTIHQAELHISKLFDELAPLLQTIAAQKNIRLIWDVDSSVRAWCDNEHFRIIVRNLVTNAIKFSHPNSEVIIAASKRNEWVEVTVTDHGVGIHPEKLSIDTLGTSRTNGTGGEKGIGLGLYLCKDFVRQNGGALSVTSEISKGSTFTFTLHAYRDHVNMRVAS